MKRLFICVFVILSTYEIFARVPEMYFKIDDNSYPAPTYVVKANRISHNDPLFGLNFMEVDDNNNIYDEIHSEDNAGMQQPLGDFEYIRGFNFLRCAGAFPEIGEGKIRFEIYRNDVIKFQFSIDLVSLKENGSPDIAFEFHYVDDNNISMAGTGSGNDAQTIQISNNSFVNCWDFHGQDNPTITYYTKPVTLTNLLAVLPKVI